MTKSQLVQRLAEAAELNKKQADYISLPVAGPYKPDTYRY